MTKVRGLLLASTATQKGDLSALASLTATSWERCRSTGCSDKTPVCNQNLPEAERCMNMYAVLPWPWEALTSTHQEPNYSFGGQCPNCLSLRVPRPKPICQQWLVRGQSVFRQQAQCSTHVQKRQEAQPLPLRQFVLPMRRTQGHPAAVLVNVS